MEKYNENFCMSDATTVAKNICCYTLLYIEKYCWILSYIEVEYYTYQRIIQNDHYDLLCFISIKRTIYNAKMCKINLTCYFTES